MYVFSKIDINGQTPFFWPRIEKKKIKSQRLRSQFVKCSLFFIKLWALGGIRWSKLNYILQTDLWHSHIATFNLKIEWKYKTKLFDANVIPKGFAVQI